MTELVPLRFTCVWPETVNGPSAIDWMRAVSQANELGESQLQLNSSAGFAGLYHHSLLIPQARPTTRDERDLWTRRIEAELGSENLAVAVTCAEMALRGPALVVLDADSTLFTSEVIELIASHAGTAEQVARITSAAMRGELDFAQSLRERMATLRGLPIEVIEQVRSSVRFSPGAAQMVQAFHRYGIKVGVVSGGFMEVVEPMAQEIGLDFMAANRFETDNGVLTGRPLGPIVTGEVKQQTLEKWAKHLQISTQMCVAIGDGANDILMLQTAGFGIAYRAKPALQEAADARIPFPNLAAGADLVGPTSTLINR